MSQKFTFRAIIEDPGGGGAFVRIPFDVEKAFGKKRVPVIASIEGQPYRGTLVRMGEPWHVLIILKEIRTQVGKTFGDTLEIVLEEDTQPRRVEIPSDLQEALNRDEAARAAFEKLAYTHQKEHVRALLDAKREETRRSRLEKTLQMLKHPRKQEK